MPDQPAAPAPEPVPVVPVEPVTSAQWRVDGRLTAFRIAGTFVFALAAVIFLLTSGDRMGLSLCVVATLLLLGYALRDVVAPVHLAADLDGVTVIVGYAGHRRLAWDEIERIRLDRRRRLGTRSELLEIDAGESLHLFSAYQLGVSPAEALAVLESLRRSGPTSSTA